MSNALLPAGITRCDGRLAPRVQAHVWADDRVTLRLDFEKLPHLWVEIDVDPFALLFEQPSLTDWDEWEDFFPRLAASRWVVSPVPPSERG